MSKLFKKEEQLYPWLGKPSIYEAILSKINEHGKIVDAKLPDDEEFWEGQPIRWIAGAMDGLLGRNTNNNIESKQIRKLVQLLVKQSHKQSIKLKREIYIQFMKEDTLSIVDDLMEALRAQREMINSENLYIDACWFVEKGVHRNVVKFGIALLGQFKS